jgi:phosphoglycolate phosphatase
MNPIRSITIDLDGTLLDTVPDLAAAANAMLREMGRAELPIAAIAAFIGRGIPKLVARCLPDLDDDAVEQAQVIFRRHYAIENGRRSALFPGVLEGLQAFRAAGLPMAVITNKAAAFTEPLLAATQLDSWLHACERMGTSPAENLHIGDSHHDAVAARAAGCPVFIVPYGYNEGEDVQGIDCDAIVASLAEAARRVTGQRS